jgi:hypothetical protein
MHSELCTDEAADAAVAALQFLADQAVADGVEAGAAVFFRQRGAKQAHLGDLGNQFLREPPWSKASPMIGITRSSVKRATASCTARSSSVSRERTSNRS